MSPLPPAAQKRSQTILDMSAGDAVWSLCSSVWVVEIYYPGFPAHPIMSRCHNNQGVSPTFYSITDNRKHEHLNIHQQGKNKVKGQKPSLGKFVVF